MKLLFRSILLFALGWLSYSTTWCQFELVESGIVMGTTNPVFGSGISLMDFDKDGLDDMTVIEVVGGVTAYHSNGDGSFSFAYNFNPGHEVNQVLWVDYDNDNDYDLFLASRFQSNRLYRNDGAGLFTDITLNLNPNGLVSDSEGCTWGDYDRDGLLDLFVANNDDFTQTNWLFHNLGNDTFEEVAAQLGVDGGNMNSLQATFIDLNFDGWQDIYVCEDRHGGNRCFINNAGVFTEQGSANGSGIEIDAMSNTFGDFDLDGDFDLYISNNSEGNNLLKNTNGIFENVAPQLGISINEDCWSAVWIDYDMDGWQDLYCGETESFFQNRQNFLFHHTDTNEFVLVNDLGLEGDNFNAYSSGKFDFNGDAIWDLATSNTSPPSVSVWKNNETNLNAVKLDLQGTASNRDGIGAIIRAWHNGSCKLFQTFCGENYLAQESHYEMIGLGADTLIDSLVITWPSCWVDRYYNIPTHSFLQITEGETFVAEIISSTNGWICNEGGEVYLETLSDGDYQWSTGDTLQNILVTSAGLYELIITNSFGFTDTAAYQLNLFPELPVVVETTNPFCVDESSGSIHILNTNDFVTTQLNDEMIGSEFLGLAAGQYVIYATDTNGCMNSLNVALSDPMPLAIELTFDTILCYGATTELLAEITGGAGEIELSWNTATPENVFAGEYNCLASDENNCTATASVFIPQPQPIEVTFFADTACYGGTASVEILIAGGIPAYNVNWFGQTPDNMEAGNYEVEVTDANNCSSAAEFEVSEYPELAYTLSIIEPFDGPNGQIEIIAFGGLPPYAFEWGSNSTYNPLFNIGQGDYICNITDGAGCTLTTETISLIDAGLKEDDLKVVSAYPNPFVNVLNVFSFNQEVVIHDVMGKIVWRSNGAVNQTIETSSWASGIYTVSSGNHILVLTKGE